MAATEIIYNNANFYNKLALSVSMIMEQKHYVDKDTHVYSHLHALSNITTTTGTQISSTISFFTAGLFITRIFFATGNEAKCACIQFLEW